VEILGLVDFQLFAYSHPSKISDLFPLPTPSTRCQQSVERGMKPLVWCGQLFESVVWQNASSWSGAFLMISPCVPLLCRQKTNAPVGTLLDIYDNNILKIDSLLSLTSLFNLEYNFLKFSSEFAWTGTSFWTCELNVLEKVTNWTLVMDIIEQNNDILQN
jgi:hypothetical protein